MPGLPADEIVTDLYNVAVQDGVFHLHIAPTDRASLAEARRLGERLPAAALATRSLPFARTIRVHSTPLRCSHWENTSSFFIRPYHLGNICHLYNENLLPLIETTRTIPTGNTRRLYTFKANMPQSRARPLEHWPLVTNALASVIRDASELLDPPRGSGGGTSSGGGGSVGGVARRCLSHVAWGLGPKPFYVSFRVAATQRTVARLRSLLLGAWALPRLLATAPRTNLTSPQPQPPTTVLLRRRSSEQRSLSASSLRLLSREVAIDASCDFSMPVKEQLALISNARVLVGLHGAGLANAMFAREGVVVVEFKGSYGMTDFVYRKYAQTVHGGFVALHVRETRLKHALTAAHAAIVRHCLTELIEGPATAAADTFTAAPETDGRSLRRRRCVALPHVIQVAAVGHTWDCTFRDWPKPWRPPVCPTPSWVEHVGAEPKPEWDEDADAPSGPRRRRGGAGRGGTVISARIVQRRSAARGRPLRPTRKPPYMPPRKPPSNGRRLQVGGGADVGCWRAHAHAALRPREGSRCAVRFATLLEATRSCRQQQRWCAGVTRDWKGVDVPESCRKGRLFELRQLPLSTYDGKWTGYMSWLPLPANETCEPPAPTPPGGRLFNVSEHARVS